MLQPEPELRYESLPPQNKDTLRYTMDPFSLIQTSVSEMSTMHFRPASIDLDLLFVKQQRRWPCQDFSVYPLLQAECF